MLTVNKALCEKRQWESRDKLSKALTLRSLKYKCLLIHSFIPQLK